MEGAIRRMAAVPVGEVAASPVESGGASPSQQPEANECVEGATEEHGAPRGCFGGAGTAEDRVKGPWSPEEDAILSRLVNKFGARNWSLIARGIPGRSGKSCRLRWCNQLDPSVKRRPFTGNTLRKYSPSDSLMQSEYELLRVF